MHMLVNQRREHVQDTFLLVKQEMRSADVPLLDWPPRSFLPPVDGSSKASGRAPQHMTFPAGSVRAPSAPRLAPRPVPVKGRKKTRNAPSAPRLAGSRACALAFSARANLHDVFVCVRDLFRGKKSTKKTQLETGWMDPYLSAQSLFSSSFPGRRRPSPTRQ
jgi:hypothetical protein